MLNQNLQNDTANQDSPEISAAQRRRRRSRVHEKDEFFRKIEEKLEKIKTSTDNYK